MTLLDLVRRLYCFGTDIRLDPDGNLRITRSQPPEEILAELKEHREEVVELLRAQGIGEADPVLHMPRRDVHAEDCIAPGACSCLGPCPNFLRRLPCDSQKGSRK